MKKITRLKLKLRLENLKNRIIIKRNAIRNERLLKKLSKGSLETLIEELNPNRHD